MFEKSAFSTSSTLDVLVQHSCTGQGLREQKDVHHMNRFLSRFWADESGATAIEYALIAAGISLAIIAVVNGLGTTLNEKFTSINTSLK